MKTRQLLLIWMLFSFITVSAQESKIDSLQREFDEHSAIDTAKVNLLNKLAYEIYLQNGKQARMYAEGSEKMAESINYLKGKAESLWIIGLTYSRNDTKVALDYYQRALLIAEKANDLLGMCNYLRAMGPAYRAIGDLEKCTEVHEKSVQTARRSNDQGTIIKALVFRASNYIIQNNYSKAIKDLQEVIPVANKIGDKRTLANAYGQLAGVYYRQSNHLAALEYYLSALKINEQLNYKPGIIVNLNHIGGIQTEQNDFKSALRTLQKIFSYAKEVEDSTYMSGSLMNIGYVYGKMNNPSALQYYQAALAINDNNSMDQRSAILINIGAIYTDRREFSKAKKTLEEALILTQKIQNNRHLSEVWSKIALLHYSQNQYKQAAECAQKSLAIAQEIKYILIQKDCYKLLSDIYAATGNFNQAYLNHLDYKALSDSLSNKENIRKVAFLESGYKYNKEKQDYEIEKAKQQIEIKNQRLIILFLIIASVLILMLAIAVYWTNKLKKKVLKLEIENINHELETNQKAVTAATLKLIQNSERDAHSVKMLENIKKNTVDEGQGDIRSLISEYKFKSYSSNWEEFELMFQKTNTAFYEKLNERYPNLTPNERKLCVFLKLNMSNNHISQVTFQSEEALKKARLRLRKKLELDRDTNLATFIQNL